MQNLIFVVFILVLTAGQVQAEPGYRLADVNFTNLNYVEDGKGEPVVFVHGTLGDIRTFDEVRPAIAREFRYISYSRRYHFPNKWDDAGDNYTLTQHVEDLAEFIRTLNVGPVHLVGASYGARMVATLALSHPELVRSVILNDPFLIEDNSPAAVAAHKRFFAGIKQVSQLLKENRLVAASRVFYNVNNGPDKTYGEASRQARTLVEDNAKVLLPMLRMTLPAQPSCRQIAGMKMPVLIIQGQETRDYYKLSNRALIACLPGGAHLVTVPYAAHMLFAQNPHGAAKKLLTFLRAHE